MKTRKELIEQIEKNERLIKLNHDLIVDLKEELKKHKAIWRCHELQ